MSAVILMVGLQGSGKSTYANTLGMKVIASDEIRLQHPEISPASKEIFSIMQEELKNCITVGQDVIIDAVNVTARERERWLSVVREMKAAGYPIMTYCIVMSTPIEVCLQRNENREAKVPKAAIYGTKKRYERPLVTEGFDGIRVL